MNPSRLASALAWSLVGAIAGIALFGANRAIGQGKTLLLNAHPIDGWKISGEYATDSWPAMKFSVRVENTESKARNLTLVAKLVRREFKGNPMSRVLRPGDMEERVLEERQIDVQLGAGKARTYQIDLDAKADGGAASGATYVLQFESNGKIYSGVAARPKVERPITIR